MNPLGKPNLLTAGWAPSAPAAWKSWWWLWTHPCWVPVKPPRLVTLHCSPGLGTAEVPSLLSQLSSQRDVPRTGPAPHRANRAQP